MKKIIVDSQNPKVQQKACKKLESLRKGLTQWKIFSLHTQTWIDKES